MKQSRFRIAIVASCLAVAAMFSSAPAFAQAVSIGGYIDPSGHRVAVRDSAPLPTLTQPYVVPGSRWQFAGATGGIVNTTAVALNAAAGAGVRNYLTGIQFINSAAVASEIEVRDGSTVIWRGYVPASMTVPTDIEFASPLRGTANTALNVALLTTATATRVSAQGYKSAN